MRRTRIKIDGVCRPEDAAAAAAAGVDGIGLVFHPASPRCLTIDRATAIIRRLPPLVAVVGVFVDADIDAIQRVTARLPLSAVQLHGEESPWRVNELKPMPVLKALRLSAQSIETPGVWRSAITELELTNLAGIILETAGAPGGTGVVNDWFALRRLQADGHLDGLPPLIAAGGLNPGNVGSVVQLLEPYAVDVSSGVESSLGVKSAEKIAAFVRAVREADERAGHA